MKIEAFNFTIYDVEAIHADLLAEVAKEDAVDVDMQSVEKIDMAALQLLVSAKRTCKSDNKTFALSNVSDEVLGAIRMCGLEAELGV